MKKILFSVILSFFISTTFSQTFMHGVGVSIFVTKVTTAQISAFGGVTYSPRINFLETESLALSAGVPLSLGTSGSYSYNSMNGYASESNTLRFMVNAPLIINLNVGAGSTKENESRFGFFVGGGFGYHYGDFNVVKTDEYGYAEEGNASITTYGPAANAGIRIAVGSNQKNIEARLSYMKGMKEEKPSIYGMAALFNF
jgi:hypothetical protein